VPAPDSAKPADGAPPAKPAPKEKTKNATEITAHEANFNSKAHIGIFSGDVTVLSPDFNVKCEKLTAYLRHDDTKPPADPKAAAATGKKEGATPAPATPAPSTPTPAPATGGAKGGTQSATDQKAGGLEKAIAEGGVTITQDKPGANGTVEHDTGHAQRAYYDAISGNVTLTGRPDVQQGGNLCVALDDSTIMILNRNGNMRVHGPHKTVLIDKSSPDSDPKNANAH